MKTIKKILISAISVLLFGCVQEINETEENLLRIGSKSNVVCTKSSQTFLYYWYNNEKIYMPLVEDTYFAILDLKEVNEIDKFRTDFQEKQYDYGIKSNKEDYYLCAKITGDIAQKYSEHIVYCAPYLKNSSGEFGVTDRFYVKLKSKNDEVKLERFALENGAMIIKENVIPLWYTLICGESASCNALELANKAYESGDFEKTDIEFIDDYEWNDINFYNDTFYSAYQWNLHGTYGINISDVHSMTSGSPSIAVAIVDSGFQLNHSDLSISNSWDAVSMTSPAQLYYESNGNPHSHGTSMLGIIGAIPNNNRGIAGIAPDVSFLPISIGVDLYVDVVASAIDYASSNNAKVISNSYTFTNQHSILYDAYYRALNRGCVLVQSSGNTNSTTLKYPYASIPEVIVVGNMTKDGIRNSSYSTYGEHLDIIAPGTQIITLYPDNKYGYATGTSPAAPHVAATAALMLSVNPYLTRQEVADIIERTAYKLPGYTFSETIGRPNGNWNEQVGYGLVNTYEAVSQAYYSNEDNYYSLVEFDYSGSSIELSLTVKDNIAIVWDWDTKDISYIDAGPSSPKDTTIVHTYGTSGSNHIMIAETVMPGETVPTSSSALVEFEIPIGNTARNIDIKPVNSALEYVRIIGGASFPAQTISVSDLPALKELYIVNAKNASVTVDDCPELTKFGSSRYIWGAPIGGIVINPLGTSGDSLDPNVVGDPEWPSIPEPVVSFSSLSITSCPKLHTLSLENVGLHTLNLTQFPNLKYLYLTSGSTKIVGGGSNLMNLSTYGVYLKNAIQTLPSRNGTTAGKVLLRCVSSDNSSYIPVTLGTSNYNMIMSNASSKNWNVVWDSGVNY